ncbi:MAG: MarR family winged helix-turn-helix transcriptional regulator [Ignavibacteriota bacterium]
MKAQAPELDCACLAIRQAARLVTQFYSAELQGRLEIPQFGLLSVVDRRPGCNQASLARALNLDKTTLSRNLKLMEKNGWIERAHSDDLRERGYHLTAEGKALLRTARPAWKRAQERFRAALGDTGWDALWSTMSQISEAVKE